MSLTEALVSIRLIFVILLINTVVSQMHVFVTQILHGIRVSKIECKRKSYIMDGCKKLFTFMQLSLYSLVDSSDMGVLCLVGGKNKNK